MLVLNGRIEPLGRRSSIVCRNIFIKMSILLTHYMDFMKITIENLVGHQLRN